MEAKTKFPPFPPSAAAPPAPSAPSHEKTQKSFSGVNERTNTVCGRCTSARSLRIRGDFCPYLSGITPALPIRLQSRAGGRCGGASGSSQVSGCPGLAVTTAYRGASPGILRQQEMFDISPEQRTAAEAAQKSLRQSEGGVAAVAFWGGWR